MGSKNILRFASINIQGDTNLERVVAFIREYKPDVVCFQELMQTSLEFFESALQMRGYFVPMTKYYAVFTDHQSPVVPFGVGIFSNLDFSNVRSDYYYGGVGDMPLLTINDGVTDETTNWRVLLRATITKNGDSYTIATTHFTRTGDGSTSDKQRVDLKNLLAITEKCPELILCGDFNAPRGGEIFGALASTYKDNIPPEYLSSLDTELHRIGKLKKLMVDGLFTTPQYEASEVKLSSGVSDHMAVTALISKKS